MAESRKLFEDAGGSIVRKHEVTNMDNTELVLETKESYIKAIHWSSSTTAGYIKFYDDENPVLGTDYPDMVIPVGASQDGGIVFSGDLPKFSTAITCHAATGTGKDNTNPTAPFPIAEILISYSSTG